MPPGPTRSSANGGGSDGALKAVIMGEALLQSSETNFRCRTSPNWARPMRSRKYILPSRQGAPWLGNFPCACLTRGGRGSMLLIPRSSSPMAFAPRFGYASEGAGATPTRQRFTWNPSPAVGSRRGWRHPWHPPHCGAVPNRRFLRLGAYGCGGCANDGAGRERGPGLGALRGIGDDDDARCPH
jgi:hypothetical protein